MATTVIKAFDGFTQDFVNLDKEKAKKARKSRNWLIDQIKKFPSNDADFPKLYNEKHIYFGSFARQTKIRELDDIDIMIGLSAESGTYFEYSDRIEINVLDSATKLKKLCNPGTNTLNSRKVIEKFKSALNEVSHYENAEINRNQEAATLKLTSYTWNFDIVPCFFTKEDMYGKTYYLIPDGNGNWKKTDPRIDRQRVTDTNQSHDGNVLNAIRIMKYWNRKAKMLTMGSYLIENMILDHYDKTSNCQSYADMEAVKLLAYIKDNIHNSVDDPKNIQGDLNILSWDDRVKISIKAASDHEKAVEARKFENDKDHESSINKWKEIFGSDFPTYE